MSLRHALASALHLFVVFTFFALGFFFISHLPDLFLNRSETCKLTGYGFFLAAGLLLFGFYGLNSGRYLRIRMGNRLTEIDANLIRHTLEEFLHKEQQNVSLTGVEIGRRDSLEIGVVLPPMQKKARQDLFKKLESQFQALLRHRFGYSKPFYLVVKL